MDRDQGSGGATGVLAADRHAVDQAVHALAAARSLEDVAIQATAAARRLTGADGISFVLRDGDHCHYYRENSATPLWAGQRFPANNCISGWCMNRAEVAVVEDIMTDPRIPVEFYKPKAVRSLVAMPVRQDDPVACIVAYWAETRAPSSAEVAALKTVAEVAALAFGYLHFKRRETQQRMLVGELRHRVKNLLMLVQGYAAQTLRRTATLADFRRAFNGRIQALGRSHDILFRKEADVVLLEDALRSAVSPFCHDSPRLHIAGPVVAIPSGRHVTLSMAFHELATNALKYGSLSVPEGRVGIAWTVEQDVDGGRRVALEWVETGGPPAREPEEHGFGLTFISRALRHELRADSLLDFRPEGLRATIAFSLPAPREDEEAALVEGGRPRPDVLPG